MLNKIEFIFKSLTPYSVNNTHYKNGKRKKEFRKWSEDIQLQLLKYESQIKKFVKSVDKDTTYLKVNIIHVLPEKKFFIGNKNDGGISIQSKDLSNVEKPLIDCIFDKRYSGREFKYHYLDENICTLCVDDKLITELHSRKMPTLELDFLISVKIEVHKLSDIEYYVSK